MRQNERIEKINSWIVALFLAESSVCTCINTFITIPFISAIVMLLLLFVIIITNNGKIKINPKCTYAYLFVGIILLVSILLNGVRDNGEYLMYYIVFGLTALLLISLELNYELIFQDIIKIYLIVLLVYFLRQRESFIGSVDYWRSQMGIAYSMVIPVLFAFSFIIYRKRLFSESNNIYFVLAILELVLSIYIILFDCGTRGAIITVILGGGLILIGSTHKAKTIMLIFLAMIAGVILIYQKDNILLWAGSRFSNSNILALRKYSQLLSIGSGDNGRNDYYSDAIMYFKNSPIIGNGVGYFEKYHNGSYVHELFLELLCEYGLLGMIVIIPILIRFVAHYIRTPNSKEKMFITILVAISSILLYSSSYWLLPSFWYTFFIIMTYKNKEIELYD